MRLETQCHGGQGERGFLLIEGLVAILIFSLGILELVAMQSLVVKETAEAQYRIEAAMFTNQLIGQMWAEDRANLSTNFASPDGVRYQVWRDQVTDTANGGLPGAAAQVPTVAFAGNNVVTISVFWQQPGTTGRHQLVTTTQMP